MAVSWLQGEDAAVRSHFTEVERVPKALEVTECVSPWALLRFSPGQSYTSRGREQAWARAAWGRGQSCVTDRSEKRGQGTRATSAGSAQPSQTCALHHAADAASLGFW